MSGVDDIYFNPMWDVRMTDTSLRDGSPQTPPVHQG